MFGLTMSRLEVEGIGALIIIAAVLMWLGFHDAKVANEAKAPVVAAIKAAEDAASAAEAIHAAKVEADQKGNLREANSQNAARVADAHAIADDVRRMRDDAVRASTPSRSAQPTAGGSSGVGSGADMVSRELYASALAARAEAESDAEDLEASRAGLLVSGGLCARDYDSLGAVTR